jgi:hypothetical protein
MRVLFLLLVLANLVMFAWPRGMLGEFTPSGREPARLAQQIEPQSIRILNDDEMQRVREQAAAGRAQQAACVEFGDFGAEAAVRVRARLDALKLGDRVSMLEVGPLVWYMVYLPPLKTAAGARRVVDKLRGAGLSDVAVIQDSSNLQNGVSLGQFRDLSLAQKRQAEIQQRGFGNAQISERPGNVVARFSIKGADAELAQRLAELQKEFGAMRLGTCTQ